MAKQNEIGDAGVGVGKPKAAAAGVTGVAVALKRSLSQVGPARSARTLLKLNQAEGFDCMSCAWPDPDPAAGTGLRGRRRGAQLP